MTFKQLQIFLTIVDTGNFKTAAKKLFMSAPSVSTHITALEDEIGCKLFERKHSGTKLTTEGMKMCNYAQTLLKTQSTMLTDIKGISSDAPINIQAGITEAAMAYFITDILPHYFPNDINLYFSIHQMTHEQIEKALLAGEIDTGISCAPCKSTHCVNSIDNVDSLIMLIQTDYYQSLITEDHSFDLRELLLNTPLILPSFQSELRQYVEQLIYNCNLSLSDISIAAELDRGEIILMMVAQKTGISFIKKSSLKLYDITLFKGQVSSVELPIPTEVATYIIRKEGYHFPRKMQIFCMNKSKEMN